MRQPRAEIWDTFPAQKMGTKIGTLATGYIKNLRKPTYHKNVTQFSCPESGQKNRPRFRRPWRYILAICRTPWPHSGGRQAVSELGPSLKLLGPHVRKSPHAVLQGGIVTNPRRRPTATNLITRTRNSSQRYPGTRFGDRQAGRKTVPHFVRPKQIIEWRASTTASRLNSRRQLDQRSRQPIPKEKPRTTQGKRRHPTQHKAKATNPRQPKAA